MNDEENTQKKECKNLIASAKAYLVALNSSFILDSEKEILFENCFSELERIRLLVDNLRLAE